MKAYDHKMRELFHLGSIKMWSKRDPEVLAHTLWMYSPKKTQGAASTSGNTTSSNSGKGNGGKDKRKTTAQGGQASKQPKSGGAKPDKPRFQLVNKTDDSNTAICIRWQQGKCSRADCKYSHICHRCKASSCSCTDKGKSG